MQKLPITSFALMFLAAVLFAGCSKSVNYADTETPPAETMEQSPVTSSTETEDLQTELDETIILEDDFSDL